MNIKCEDTTPSRKPTNVLKTGFPLVIKEEDNFEKLNLSGISRR